MKRHSLLIVLLAGSGASGGASVGVDRAEQSWLSSAVQLEQAAAAGIDEVSGKGRNGDLMRDQYDRPA